MVNKMESEKLRLYKQWYAQVRNWKLQSLFLNLNMTQKNNRFGPCPACGATHDRLGRPPIKIYKNDQFNVMERWLCNAIDCKVKGNIFDFVAYRQTGMPASMIKNGFAIQQLFYELNLADEPTNTAPPIQKREYPPVDEVLKLLQSCTLLKHTNNKRVVKWCKRRGLIQDKMITAGVVSRDFDYNSLTVSKNSDKGLPWFPDFWAKYFPVLIPMVDFKGDLKSLMGRSLDTGKRKTTCPIGYSTSNLFFANKKARQFLKKEIVPEKIWIVEGEMDYLTISMSEKVTAIGIRSGSTNHVQLMPWQKTQTVLVATDNDKQGDIFAEETLRNIFPAKGVRVDMRKLGGK